MIDGILCLVFFLVWVGVCFRLLFPPPKPASGRSSGDGDESRPSAPLALSKAQFEEEPSTVLGDVYFSRSHDNTAAEPGCLDVGLNEHWFGNLRATLEANEVDIGRLVDILEAMDASYIKSNLMHYMESKLGGLSLFDEAIIELSGSRPYIRRGYSVAPDANRALLMRGIVLYASTPSYLDRPDAFQRLMEFLTFIDGSCVRRLEVAGIPPFSKGDHVTLREFHHVNLTLDTLIFSSQNMKANHVFLWLMLTGQVTVSGQLQISQDAELVDKSLLEELMSYASPPDSFREQSIRRPGVLRVDRVDLSLNTNVGVLFDGGLLSEVHTLEIDGCANLRACLVALERDLGDFKGLKRLSILDHLDNKDLSSVARLAQHEGLEEIRLNQAGLSRVADVWETYPGLGDKLTWI